MTRSRSVALILLVALAVSAIWYRNRSPAPTSTYLILGRRTLPLRVAGCWDLFDHSGRPAGDSLYWAPSTTRLDTMPSPWVFNGLSGVVWPAVRFDSFAKAGALPDSLDMTSAFWSADSLSDSIRLKYSSGFSGTTFVFALPPRGMSSDTLRGYAVEHSDMVVPGVPPKESVYAVRTPCTP